MRTFRFVGPAVIFAGVLCSGNTFGLIVTSGTSVDAAGITAVRDSYRTILGGGTVAGANGSFGGLRREINWDGVPDAQSAPNNLAGNFFNVNSPRGVILSTPGTAVQVSAAASVGNIEFDNIKAGDSSLFAPFSAPRLFTSIGSNVTTVDFFVPGTVTPALTRGFGAIFSDVDLPTVTSIQYFDKNGASLGTFFVPNLLGNETFEFLGVDFETPVVAQVRITTGNAALALGASDGGGTDLVVMDDFIYAEPVPEPASVMILAVGAVGLLGRRRRGA